VAVPEGVTLVNEVQQLQCGASAGTFRLRFRGAETADIPFNADALRLQTELELLGPCVRVTNRVFGLHALVRVRRGR
jgi:hypothetical protein